MFGNYYPRYKAQKSYEWNLQYWITKYEDVDNNKDISYYFEPLSIDIIDYTLKSALVYIIFEQFHTLIS